MVGADESAHQPDLEQFPDLSMTEHWATRDDLSTMIPTGVIPRP